MDKSLDFLKRDVIKSRDYYKENSDKKYLKIILMGETGTGKTLLARKSILPVHIDSFDPGGTNTIQDLIDKGDVVADTSFELEDPLAPKSFDLWRNKFRERVDNGYFNHFGTYFLDSFTTWSDAVLNAVLKKGDRLGKIPKWEEDYTLQKGDILTWIRRIVILPCDVIMTAHLEFDKDADGTNSRWRLATVGRAAIPITSRFDEKWVSRARTIAGKVEYSIITAPVDNYSASTRIGRGGMLKPYEEPDLKAIRAKCGWSTQDKPPLHTLINE